MEELANLVEGSSLHEVKINQIIESDDEFDVEVDEIGEECGFIDSIDSIGSRNRLRNLFDELFGEFSSERLARTSCRSVPDLHGNGSTVDLFKLFWVVRKIGGYDTACSKGLWGFVAKQCGSGIGDVALLKLNYVKYLNEFDEWLWNLYGGSCLVSKESKIDRKLDFFLQELEAKFRTPLSSEREGFKPERKFGEWEYEKSSAATDFCIGRCVSVSGVGNGIGLHMMAKGKNNHGNTRLLTDIDKDLNLSKKRVVKDITNEGGDNANKQSTEEDCKLMVSSNKFNAEINSKHCAVNIWDECCLIRCDKMMSSARNDIEKVLHSQKRKRELFSLVKMLHWVKDAAKHSNSVEIGGVPECTNWKNHATQEAWIQALLIREARFKRRYSNSNAEEASQQSKKRRTSSLICTNTNLSDSRRLCKRCLTSQLKDKDSHNTDSEIGKQRNMENNIFTDEPDLKVSVGPQFQAKIPEWTSNISESDSKWLGTRLWPPECEREPILELLPIGKGRENQCDCQCKNSVECMRFHIAEKRLKLKIELGSVFYGWMFNRMGEEVSLSWTEEEEDRFKSMLALHAESRNKFWKDSRKLFPSKKRGALVSYYFNVFLIQRRIYQNRVTPYDIDSDDDEKQFGSVGERFGYAALNPQRPYLISCTESKECLDFE